MRDMNGGKCHSLNLLLKLVHPETSPFCSNKPTTSFSINQLAPEPDTGYEWKLSATLLNLLLVNILEILLIIEIIP